MLKVARDTPDEVRARLAEALAFDVVLSTGGVSVGQFDHVKGVLDELGLRQLFHGVAQKPGRPLKFGTIGGRPIFGLPGKSGLDDGLLLPLRPARAAADEWGD